MLLTKSDYMIGLQCLRYLWVKVHQPEKLPEPDEITQHRFNEGHLVNEQAHKLYPSGILVQTECFNENIEKTKELLKQRKPLFEAGILAGDLYARADILKPVGKGKWDVIELKSSTKVKDEHLLDVAFQKYVYEKFGLKVRKYFLMHINNEYIKKGEIDPKEFFIKQDITEEVNEKVKEVEDNIKEMFRILSLEKPPEFNLIDIEKSFHEHPMLDEFYESLPLESVFELYRGGKKCIDLFGKHICLLADIPDEFKLTSHQEIQKRCAKTKKTHINKEKLDEFLKTLKYPLYYFDFETFSSAIPFYDGTRPYQQVPFQFSLHVVKDKNSSPEHVSYLAEGCNDPRPKLLSALKKFLGKKGSIIVYNRSFEKKVLKDLAEFSPKEKKWIESVIDRIIDLIVPFQNFYYYNPKQKGSASLKGVLPAVTGKNGYEKLKINGDTAGLAYLNLYFGEKIPEEEKEIRKDLEKYCGLDTEGMVWIVDKLKEIVK